MFVQEALNLSQFLEKVVVDKQSQDLFNMNGTEHSSTSLQNLDTLDFNDWVGFIGIHKDKIHRNFRGESVKLKFIKVDIKYSENLPC